MSQAPSRVSFNIPGKTFLLGEYVALTGGPSLVASTSPNFEVDFFPGEGQHPFHQDSPAGKFIAGHAAFFKNFDIEFYDPYETGGFGASTAQFIAVAGIQKKYDDIVAQKPFNFKNPIVALDIWNTYRELFADQDVPPSGADLIAQIVGGISSFRADRREWEKIEWPFQNVGPSFYKTPFKINTHEHLADLRLQELPIAALTECVEHAIAAIKKEDFSTYKEECRKFLVIQEGAGLLTPDVRAEIIGAAKAPGVSLVRGCGALGADVVAVYGGGAPEFPRLKKIVSLPEGLAYGTWMEAD